MGLDSFWRSEEDPEQHVEVEFPWEPQLCGGIFSAHGCDSFRGKVYSSLVQEITGVSLYQEKIHNKVVKEMADKLDAMYVEVNALTSDLDLAEFGRDKQELRDLAMVFRTYADAGAALYGWW